MDDRRRERRGRFREEWTDPGRRHGASRSRSTTPPSRRERRRERSPPRHEEERTRRDEPRHHGSSHRRSPDKEREGDAERKHRHHRHAKHHRSHDEQRPSRPPREKKAELPFEVRHLHKSDLNAFRSLLAYYLDVQKQRDMTAMDEREVRGRWKSFVGKWNAGELAEGWYDPAMFARVKEMGFEVGPEEVVEPKTEEEPRKDVRVPSEQPEEEEEDEDDDDSDIGPVLPPTHRDGQKAAYGAPIPSLTDLRLRDELVAEERTQNTTDAVSNLRLARRLDREEQKDRLDELVPRADAGSHERRLEKKRETNDKMRAFRDKSPGGAAEVADEGTLLGEDVESSLGQLKREREVHERKKTERELRREEAWRARMAEREERVKEYKDREQGTIEMLKELAKRRGGPGL